MQATKCSGNVAIPANWTMSGEDCRKLFGPQFSPFDGLEICAEQPWRVIQVMKLTESLVTNRAILSLIPLGDNIPDQTVFGIYFDLLQAILTAIFSLGPARALFQTQDGIGEEGTYRSLAGRDIHGCGLVRFRASDEALAPVTKIRRNSWNGSEDKQADCDCQNGNRHQNNSCHKSPRRRPIAC